MKADVKIEGPGKGQEGEDQARRVEDTGLKVTKERSAAKIIRAPVRDESVLQELGEEVLSRIKPPMNVPKKEGVVGEKNRVKEEEHQEGRYSEAGMIYQIVQSHCRLIASRLLTIGEPISRAKLQAEPYRLSNGIV
ncbi:MAG: hypothetical protein MUC98_17135 [Desulfobacterota bacterium]|nr:hypothetical protein [Thermodesulfobacteriota bacterium]